MNEQNEQLLEEYGPDLVTVEDDEGNVHTFEKLDAIETDNARYVALLPFFEDPADMLEDAGELIIVEVQESEEGSLLLPIEDDDLYDEIASVFEERLSEYYEIDSE